MRGLASSARGRWGALPSGLLQQQSFLKLHFLKYTCQYFKCGLPFEHLSASLELSADPGSRLREGHVHAGAPAGRGVRHGTWGRGGGHRIREGVLSSSHPASRRASDSPGENSGDETTSWCCPGAGKAPDAGPPGKGYDWGQCPLPQTPSTKGPHADGILTAALLAHGRAGLYSCRVNRTAHCRDHHG